MRWLVVFYSVIFLVLPAAGRQPTIPVPTGPQIRWQNYERIMFVHFNPTTWTGREYDDLSLPLSRMNPEQLDTDQWCRTAVSWGAKMILMVAKHTGGFCWWQTNTTDYGVRNIPWRDGCGDVLRDLSRSCRKYGLDLGVYIYPGDEKWGAGVGSGGRTRNPADQAAYNQVYRRQLTEVLTRYGPIREIWFDGSCLIDVSDLLDKYGGDAVIFQGPGATIRWVGNEDGIAPCPNWYTVRRSDLATGVATALQSDPDGDAYAPVEMDLPLLAHGGHKWFWAAHSDSLLLSVEELMEVYYKSVGRGGVMLLNSTPDTSGQIPESHVRIYEAFGKEINRRFGHPLFRTSGRGREITLSLTRPVFINHVIIQEALSHGQRVQEYRVEGRHDGRWMVLCQGTSIGSKKIDPFERIAIDRIRLIVSKDAAEPRIRTLAGYDVQGFDLNGRASAGASPSRTVASWDSRSFGAGWQDYKLDLTSFIDGIGQYELNFQLVSYDWQKDWGLEFEQWRMEMYGREMSSVIERLDDAPRFRITHSQQTDRTDQIVFRTKIRSKPGGSLGTIELKKIAFE